MEWQEDQSFANCQNCTFLFFYFSNIIFKGFNNNLSRRPPKHIFPFPPPPINQNVIGNDNNVPVIHKESLVNIKDKSKSVIDDSNAHNVKYLNMYPQFNINNSIINYN